MQKLFLLISVVLAAAGCVNEKLGDCTPKQQGVRVQLALPAAAKDVEVYVFDEATGLLKAVVNASAEDVRRGTVNLGNLPAGTYTLVAVASNGPDVNSSGLIETQASGTNSGRYPAAQVGVTKLEDFRIALGTQNIPTGTVGVSSATAMPTVSNLEDLYYSVKTGVVVGGANSSTTTALDFTKVSATLNVTIVGIQNLTTANNPTGQPLLVYAVGPNGAITAAGTSDPNSPNVRYNPTSQSVDGDNMSALIKSMRIDISQAETNPVMLYIQDPLTGNNLVEPINVTRAILQMRDSSGELKYTTQAQVDAAASFPFTIELARSASDGSLTAKVVVEDFRPSPVTPEA